MTQGYRQSHVSTDSASRYDRRYSEKNHETMLWSLEQSLLLQELTRLRARKPRIEYLDFACGTGRLLSFLESRVEKAVGIEIAENMLSVARGKVESAQLICKDITVESGPPEARYDLITAFRFLLNAEPSLRLAALKALARRLRDRGSRLIVNNHNNLPSYRIIAWPLHRLRQSVTGTPKPNYLSRRQIKSIFEMAGLELIATHGYGQFSAHVVNLLSLDRLRDLESALVDAPLLWRFATHQMYVARLQN